MVRVPNISNVSFFKISLYRFETWQEFQSGSWESTMQPGRSGVVMRWRRDLHGDYDDEGDGDDDDDGGDEVS